MHDRRRPNHTGKNILYFFFLFLVYAWNLTLKIVLTVPVWTNTFLALWKWFIACESKNDQMHKGIWALGCTSLLTFKIGNNFVSRLTIWATDFWSLSELTASTICITPFEWRHLFPNFLRLSLCVCVLQLLCATTPWPLFGSAWRCCLAWSPAWPSLSAGNGKATLYHTTRRCCVWNTFLHYSIVPFSV